MEIIEVNTSDYEKIIASPYHLFGSAKFNDLNKDKCDSVHYLLFKEGRYRMGIIGGNMDNSFQSPFSAPFGGFTYLSEDIRLQHIEGALYKLKDWAEEKGYRSICVTLPPSIYCESFITKQINCMFRMGYDIIKMDLNYSFNIDGFDTDYSKRIWYNARKNLQIAKNASLNFMKCNTDLEKRIAYSIIQKNRDARGYPLRMTWQQVANTTQIIPADFFVVYTDQKIPVASAILFHINQTVVQVIYWGDLQGYSELKLMNFLAFKVFEYYKSYDKKIVDVGPSTENSIPNYGLCEFKESIGCCVKPKYTYTKKLR